MAMPNCSPPPGGGFLLLRWAGGGLGWFWNESEEEGLWAHLAAAQSPTPLPLRYMVCLVLFSVFLHCTWLPLTRLRVCNHCLFGSHDYAIAAREPGHEKTDSKSVFWEPGSSASVACPGPGPAMSAGNQTL
ncbi:uncharacterized protein LOC110436260 [Sorghum bicolor]|uniref:uncharacterized protein LOC110436260 n=1 Tax=Sorghum bicolor TaxID=4558 RepID=UPI00081AC970|nr:uncharacterized protein LOC110436260 [Sorghum bicolor]|eukprot:XP_021318469.1 uncharacterized protein LOC110436260 [Sorghum bicolor]